MIDSPAHFAKGFGMKLPRPAPAALAARFVLCVLCVFASTLASPAPAADAPFRHFVSFQFKEGTSEEKKDELVKAFLALKDRIDAIVDLEWGAAENIEPLNDGFTHSFLVTFKDKAGLAAYLPHPAHEAFVAILKPHLGKVYVFDYAAKN